MATFFIRSLAVLSYCCPSGTKTQQEVALWHFLKFDTCSMIISVHVPDITSEKIRRRTRMWSLIVAIIVGFIAGLIARAIHPGNDKAGFIVTTLLGIAGALVATYGGRMLGLYDENSAAGFIASVVGALIILFIYNMITKRSRVNHHP